jgi:hypothetical protein
MDRRPHTSRVRTVLPPIVTLSDKNFDDKIAYEEFYSWWSAAGTLGAGRNMSV